MYKMLEIFCADERLLSAQEGLFLEVSWFKLAQRLILSDTD
jgi:hypothetical protein